MKKLLIGVLMMTSFAASAGSTVALSCPTYGDVLATMNDGYFSITTDKDEYLVSKGTDRFTDKGEIVTVQMAAKKPTDSKFEQMAAVMIKTSDAIKGYMVVMLPGKHAEACKITDRQSY